MRPRVAASSPSNRTNRVGTLAFLAGCAAVAALALLSPAAQAVVPGALSVTLAPAAPSSIAAGASAVTYQFTFVLANTWPLDGKLSVTYPSGFVTTGATAAQTGCTATLGANSGASPTATFSRTGGGVADCAAATSVVATLTGITNSATSGPFTITVKTQTAGGATIDIGSVVVTITGKLKLTSITPANTVAGALTSYRFDFQTLGTWPANGKMEITFPPGDGVLTTAPTSSDFRASGVTGVVGTPSAVGCATGTFSFAAPAAAPAVQTLVITRNNDGSQCAPGDTGSITVSNVRNPGYTGSLANPIIFPTGAAKTRTSAPADIDSFSRIVTDGVTNTDTTLGSATAAFTPGDVGVGVSGAGITAGTKIATYVSPTSVTLTLPTTATAAGVTVTFTGRGIAIPIQGLLAPVTVTPGSSVAGAITTYAIQMTTANPIPPDGQVFFTFPTGYDVTGVGSTVGLASSSADCLTGTPTVTPTSSVVVKLVRGGVGSLACPPGSVTFTLSGIRNPMFSGAQFFSPPLAGAIQTNAGTAAPLFGALIDTNQRCLVAAPLPCAAADGTTVSGSTTLTSAVATFSPTDIGAAVKNANVPAGTTILGYTSSTAVTMSAPATGSATAATTLSYGAASILPGAFTTPISVTAVDTKQASGGSRYDFGFTLANDWPANGKFVVVFPADYDLAGFTASGTRLVTSSGCALGAAPTVAVSGQTVTVTKDSGGGAALCTGGPSSAITLRLTDSTPANYPKNAPYSGNSGTFTFCTALNTYAGTTCGLAGTIDVGTGSETLLPGTLTPVLPTIVPANAAAGALTSYTFTLQIANKLPQNGKFVATFPAEYDLAGFSSVPGVTGPFPCATGSFAVTRSGQDLTVTRSGGSDCLATGPPTLSFTFTGVKNPTVSGTTSAFSFKTTTGSGAAIDVSPTPTIPVPLTVNILRGQINTFTVTPTSYKAGAATPYAVSATLANPLPGDGKVVMVFPAGFDVSGATFGFPASGTICVSGTWTVATGTLGGFPAVTVTRAGGTSCPAGTAWPTIFGNVKNPPVSGPVTFAPNAFLTQNALSVDIDASTPTPSITITPGALTGLGLSLSDVGAGATGVAYQFQFTTANAVTGGKFLWNCPSGATCTAPTLPAGTSSGCVPSTPVGGAIVSAVVTCPAATVSTIQFGGITNPPVSAFVVTICTVTSATTCGAASGVVDTGSISLSIGGSTPVGITASDLSPCNACTAYSTYTFDAATSSTWPASGTISLQFPVGYAVANMGKTVTDGVTTTGSATIVSATAGFSTNDIGRPVTGAGVPVGAYVLTYVDSSTVTLSSTATATGTGVSLAFWPKATMVGCTTGALRADPPVGSPPAITVSRITIPPGSAPANCAPVSHFKLSLDRIQNPSLRGRTAPFDMKFLSGAVTLEEHTGTVFIGEPASRLQAPTTTFTGLPADRVITLQVQALDSIGNGVPGIIIAWTRPSGTGTLLATTSITDDSGFASADFKVGAGGAAATVKATAPGTLTGNPVTFNINQAGTTGGGGNVAHLTVTSTPTTASADSASFVLTATGTDSSNANLGDVTSTTTFTIAPDGTCTGHTCTATTAGSHTITGNNGGTTATTPVTVTGGAAKSIQADAGTLPVQAPGGTQQIKAKVLDAHSNPVSGVTVTWTVQSGGGSLASATSTSGADGFAQNTVTTGSTAGDNIVTATFTGNTGPDASFTVTSAAVGSITPLQGTLNTVAGAAVTLEAVVKDASGNHLVGATVTWTTPDTGSLGGVTSVSGANGIASNTFTRSGTGSVTIQAAVGSLTPAAFHVSITPGPVDHITISPLTANVDAGETKAFTVTAFDSHGNSIGDVTSAATFDISPDGQCNGSVCSADEAGDHTVTATKSGRTATATLDVKGTTTTTSQPSPSIGFAAVVIALVGQLLLVRRRSR